MFIDKDQEQFMLPLFGLWEHTADQLPPPDALVLGYNLLITGGCQVALLYCEYELDEDGDLEGEPEWFIAFRELAHGGTQTPVQAPIAWCQVRFNFPSAPLGQCEDCGGYFKGDSHPCDEDEDDD
jgi:hypothetical protein